MAKTMMTELDLTLRDVTFHTDAETVLKWIISKSAKISVFVGNRIGKIRRETAENQWHHILGIHDCLYRTVDYVKSKFYALNFTFFSKNSYKIAQHSLSHMLTASSVEKDSKYRWLS